MKRLALLISPTMLFFSTAVCGATLSKMTTLPNGVQRPMKVVVPESKAKTYETKGFVRDRTVASRQDAARYRNAVCRAAVNPPKGSRAPLAQMCSDATKALAEQQTATGS